MIIEKFSGWDVYNDPLSQKGHQKQLILEGGGEENKIIIKICECHIDKFSKIVDALKEYINSDNISSLKECVQKNENGKVDTSHYIH